MATNPYERRGLIDQAQLGNPTPNNFGDSAAVSSDSLVQRVNTGGGGGPLSKVVDSMQPRTGTPSSNLSFGNTTQSQQHSTPSSLLRAAGIQTGNIAGQQFYAPTVAHSGNDWTASENLRRMKMDAGSLIHRSAWAPKGSGQAAQRAYQSAALADHAAMTTGQAQADVATMQQNAGIVREGVQQSGANQRHSLAEMAGLQRAELLDAGAMQRTLVEQGGANLRTGMETQNRSLMAAMQAQAAARKAPEGYRFSQDGSAMEAIPGGPADPRAGGGKPLNDTQAKSLQFGARMQSAGGNLDSLAAQGVDQPGLIRRAFGAVGMDALGNLTQNSQQQQVEQSQRDFINATLRRESGAAIAETEFDNARKQYFPQVGDRPEVIEQKRRNREISTNGILAEVPNAQQRLGQVLAPSQPQPQPQPVAAQSGQPPAPGAVPAQMSELQRRAANNPVLAKRLQEMGY